MSPDAHGNFRGKRLVVFGCGYVGGEVARQALARGMAVTALTRNEAKAILLRAAGLKTVVADLGRADWHTQIAAAPEYVLNSVSSGGGGLDGYRNSYRAGMNSIIEWAHAHGRVGTCVYTSSTSVYPQNGGVGVTELAATGGDERAAVLQEVENRLEGAKGAWARWFILRLAGIYGPARHHLLNQVRAGAVAGHGEHRLNLAHRDDIVAAIWACFAAPDSIRNEVFNVADDAPARKAEVVEWLAARLGVSAPRFTGSPAGGRRAITPDRVIVNQKLKTVLGWQPRFATFRDGYENLLSR